MAQTATWQEPRLEESLWQSVRRAEAPRLRFGDYGVVHPIPAKGYPGRHITVKYTCPSSWLYLRERWERNGEGSSGEGERSRARTLRVVCRNLIESGSYAGPAYSWGDQQIEAAATGRGTSLGDTSKPVAFGTSHHLAYLNGMAAA